MTKYQRNLLSGFLRRFSFLFSDKIYLKWNYYLNMNRKLDLKNPQTMNEKLNWLKLYQRDPLLTTLVDKIAVKSHVAKILGEEIVCPLLHVWDRVDEIDLDMLPNSFVLKTNHSGGNTGVVICKDKSKFDFDSAKRKLQESLDTKVYQRNREWPYKNVKRKVFAEQFLGDNLIDYKFYCFNGYVDCVMLCIDRQSGSPKFYFFDKDWHLCRYNKRGKAAPPDFTLPMPPNIGTLFHDASILSKGFPFVRMDFYDVNGRIYFGEYTFYPSSGWDPNYLPETDLYFGQLIDLSLIKEK